MTPQRKRHLTLKRNVKNKEFFGHPDNTATEFRSKSIYNKKRYDRRVLQRKVKRFIEKHQEMSPRDRNDKISTLFKIDRNKVTSFIFEMNKIENINDLSNLIVKKNTWKYPTDEEILNKGWKHYLLSKLSIFFKSRKEATKHFDEAVKKLEENPICYLTGEKIDFSHPKRYALDHIIPRSKGGSNELSNLAFTTRVANQAKSDLLYEEFVALCKKVVDHSCH